MNLPPKLAEKPWWNRPLFGNMTLLERLLNIINRQAVSNLALSLHSTEWEELTRITPTLENLDGHQFNPEFLLYISLKNQLENNQGQYQDLNSLIKIIRLALEKNSHFQTIQKIELDYQGKTQRELYDFVIQQLTSNLDPLIFKQSVHQKVEELISIIRNEPTRNALKSYLKALDVISEDKIGLNVLLLFKKHDLGNYQVFDLIETIFKKIKNQNLENLKSLVLVVKLNYEEIKKIGQVIGVNNSQNEPITYAKILQYIGLCYKYEALESPFKQLGEILLQWQKHYQNIMDIREAYPAYKYKLPPEFTQEIPGQNIYEKYKDYLFI
jgi:hypothetical protein